VQCSSLGVSGSNFYARRARGPRVGAQTDAAILQTIRSLFVLSDSTHGIRRMIDKLRDAGHTYGRKRVARCPRHGAQLTASNVLDCDFTATAPNQKWAADFSYFWTGEGWMHSAAMLDLFSGRVGRWSMQSTLTHQLLAELLVACSMSGSGDLWDNSVMERFCSRLKVERCYWRRLRTWQEERVDVFYYVDRLYNPAGRNSTLGNISPVALEQQAEVAQLTVHGSWGSSISSHRLDSESPADSAQDCFALILGQDQCPGKGAVCAERQCRDK